jgi:hypothetical protein
VSGRLRANASSTTSGSQTGLRPMTLPSLLRCCGACRGTKPRRARPEPVYAISYFAYRGVNHYSYIDNP